MHIRTTLLLTLLFTISISFAQNKRYQQNIVNSKDSSLFISIIKLFKGKPNSFIDSTNIAINKSINSIATHEGKRINSIHIEHKHFGTIGIADSNLK
jgi:hypothetical protein